MDEGRRKEKGERSMEGRLVRVFVSRVSGFGKSYSANLLVP